MPEQYNIAFWRYAKAFIAAYTALMHEVFTFQQVTM